MCLERETGCRLSRVGDSLSQGLALTVSRGSAAQTATPNPSEAPGITMGQEQQTRNLNEFMKTGVDLSLPAEERVAQIRQVLLDNPGGPVGGPCPAQRRRPPHSKIANSELTCYSPSKTTSKMPNSFLSHTLHPPPPESSSA
jgi:hypothetical protein